MIERKKAPPIPYLVSVVKREHSDGPDVFISDVRPHIEDWRLEIDFRREVPAILWLELRGELEFDPLRTLVRVAGGDHTRVDITFAAVIPEHENGRWQVTFHEVSAWNRAAWTRMGREVVTG